MKLIVMPTNETIFFIIIAFGAIAILLILGGVLFGNVNVVEQDRVFPEKYCGLISVQVCEEKGYSVEECGRLTKEQLKKDFGC